MDFSITEFFPGMGTLCSPFAEGLALFGNVSVAGAVELDGRYLKLFSQQHPEASTFLGSVTAYSPEETSVAQGRAFKVFLAGTPCTGASKAGRAKGHLSAAEMHSDVGHLFLPTLHFVTVHLPEVLVMENVPSYKNTFSAAMIRAHLVKLGYELTEYTVNPFSDFNTATERIRWILVASRIGKFEWRYTPKAFAGTIEHLLDPISAADLEDEFSAEQVAAHTKYLARKAAEGCGFKRRILDRSSQKVPTILKCYSKIHPSGVFVRSGTSQDSYRLLRPREVARIHGFGPEFIARIEKLPAKVAFETLGQGVVAPPFRSLGAALGRWVAERRQLAAA